MWTPESIAALCTSVVAVIGAVTVLVRQVQHKNDPNAHPPTGGGAGQAGAQARGGGPPGRHAS